MFRKKLFACASLLACVPFAHAAAPTVAFIGGSTLYQWANSGIFGANPDFIFQSYGERDLRGPGPCHETYASLDALQSIIQSNQKPVVVILDGADDAAATSDSNPVAWQLTTFDSCYANLVQTATRAGLKVVLGTNPFAVINDITPYNLFIHAYGAANNIPVIDFKTMLDRQNENFEGTLYEITPANGGQGYSITNKGYALMNRIADEVLLQVVKGVKLKSGYLGVDTLAAPIGGDPNAPASGLNTVSPGAKQHWQAYGNYSNGETMLIENADIDGIYGFWTSSNPGVVYIDPYGNATAISPGTANIHFTTLSGQILNEWTMYVEAFSNQSL